LDSLVSALKEFLVPLSRERPVDRGIINSEMAAVLAISRMVRAERVVESGRFKGQSTYILAKYLPDVEVVSMDRCIEAYKEAEEIARKRLSVFENVDIRTGDALDALVPCIAEKTVPTVVLLDGPKGPSAVSLLRKAFTYDHVRAGFIHDMPSWRTDARQASEDAFENAFYTDDERYVAMTRHCDVETDDWKPYVLKGNSIDTYGPTMGCYVPVK
jgi:hypothetical protein